MQGFHTTIWPDLPELSILWVLKFGTTCYSLSQYGVGCVLHFLPDAELEFSTELLGEEPIPFNESINLFLLEIPFIFKGLNPFPYTT
jgi:hypothetical protein